MKQCMAITAITVITAMVWRTSFTSRSTMAWSFVQSEICARKNGPDDASSLSQGPGIHLADSLVATSRQMF